MGVALRRMNMQDVDSQRDALERAIIWLVADNWRCPVKSLARLYWLGAPLKLKGRPADFSSLLPAVLKSRTQELDGPDVAFACCVPPLSSTRCCTAGEGRCNAEDRGHSQWRVRHGSCGDGRVFAAVWCR